jgi:hypothetical protein
MKPTTLVAFNIESTSTTDEVQLIFPTQKNVLYPSLIMLGTLLFLGSAPANVAQTSPSALRPPILRDLAEADRRNSYKPSDAIEHGITRLREFGRYLNDWDSNGAAAPSQDSINKALQFLTSLEPWHPTPLTTLSRQGEPIIEFEDSGARSFGSICFVGDDFVELYWKLGDEPSKFLSGELSSDAVKDFLAETMNLPTL